MSSVAVWAAEVDRLRRRGVVNRWDKEALRHAEDMLRQAIAAEQARKAA